MMNQILMDSSFVAALNNPKDKYHITARRFVAANGNNKYLLPDIVIPEVAFVLHRTGGALAVVHFLEDMVMSKTQLQSLMLVDIDRAREIKVAYPKAEFDVVDCCIMALSERLNIQQICTYDRRDFAIFRPTHCDYLELLPE